MKKLNFSASAKFLLFGEYLVLRGAKALVLPLRFRQNLAVKSTITDDILWCSYEKGKLWFEALFAHDLSIIKANNEGQATVAQKLLRLIHSEKPGLKLSGLNLRLDIDFNRRFGLGTSSTLCSLLAQWSGTDPYFLQQQVFKGSGFDIAAATAPAPFTYQLIFSEKEVNRMVKPASIHKNIADHLLFIYTGKKQSSKEEVISFIKMKIPESSIVGMNNLVDETTKCTDIIKFENLMARSEKMLSDILGRTPVKDRLFRDYPFAIKSLGAWGGDFIMAAFRDKSAAIDYFRKKKMFPVFNFQEVIKK